MSIRHKLPRQNGGVADASPDFLAAAKAFRSALASEDELEPREFARAVRNAVARVYLAATMLPAAQLPASGVVAAQARQLSDVLEERMRARLADSDTLVAGGLVEIDCELAKAVARLEDGRPDALSEARFSFESRWATPALDVLQPLHELAKHGVV